LSWALLIVEDDDAIREELTEILAARGFHAYASANGAEAVELANERGIKPSIVLLDLVMPVMDGVEFLERQDESPLLKDVPVVILTAQIGRVPKQMPPSVRAVLEKPIPLAELIAIIQHVCGSVVRSGVPRFARGSGGLEAKEITGGDQAEPNDTSKPPRNN
jgi:CheY-like chemotaxis protein